LSFLNEDRGFGKESIWKDDEISFGEPRTAWDNQRFGPFPRHYRELLTPPVINGIAQRFKLQTVNAGFGAPCWGTEDEDGLEFDPQSANPLTTELAEGFRGCMSKALAKCDVQGQSGVECRP
jgi:hypothetical protein